MGGVEENYRNTRWNQGTSNGGFFQGIIKVKISSEIQISSAVSIKQPKFHSRLYYNMSFEEQIALPDLQL